MRALTYHDSNDVRVDNMPDPTIQEVYDIILKVTATAICHAAAAPHERVRFQLSLSFDGFQQRETA